jgi:hypothetical protein
VLRKDKHNVRYNETKKWKKKGNEIEGGRERERERDKVGKRKISVEEKKGRRYREKS